MMMMMIMMMFQKSNVDTTLSLCLK